MNIEELEIRIYNLEKAFELGLIRKKDEVYSKMMLEKFKKLVDSGRGKLLKTITFTNAPTNDGKGPAFQPKKGGLKDEE